METYIPTKSELSETVSKAVEEAVSNRLPEIIRRATEKKHFTISEACDFLDCTRRHLLYLRQSGQINYIKNGRKIYFRREDLERFFDDHMIEAEAV